MIWHNNAVLVELGVQSASSSKPLGATSEANEPVLRPDAFSFSKDAPMTGTTHAETTTEPKGLEVAAPVAKSKPQTIREFQRALHELGFSLRESKSIAEGGFKAIKPDEPEEDLSDLAALIATNTSIFLKVPK
ncbi:MAG: hypothetical protein IPG23_08605 [Burkholderiales bacterium]|jgi:hypothetical protein|nr:hypothetical protein [Burkholderiales bacterium]